MDQLIIKTNGPAAIAETQELISDFDQPINKRLSNGLAKMWMD